MNAVVESITDVTRPKLMPRKTWTRKPTFEEAQMIPLYEERYLKARTLFEYRDARARDSYNQNPDPIAPDMYVKWLRTATQRYNERNAEWNPALYEGMKIEKATLAGLGFIEGPSRHGEVPLTLAPHHWRVRGEGRGFMADGDRVHLHHSPKYETIKYEIEYRKAISVGIGDRLHQRLHKARDLHRAHETRWQQVNRDFDFLTPQLHARGHTAHEIKQARDEMHDLNFDLGLYARGR